ncbi:hypothetical protein FIBSPDRAFT_748313 [Athelia psychrophila]|uniref:Uncharacterized protein n=1 Tax=Athelia psychrophila TaxID=1759441 RepID=A0A166FFH1_9AGAM|nr:hypothetical protein FIBSPDRAFT_748313 [Fibularhizoctonia sp. CBS 109695]
MDGISAYYTDKPKCWKLATVDPESGDKEEVVITIQGIICQKELPPLMERPSSRSIHFVRQQIQLTGLECSIFKRTVQTIQRLDHLLSRQVPDGKMDPLQLPSAFCDTALEPGNRYFTARRDDPDSKDLPFDPAVDPKGILEGIRTSSYFHGQDNQVMYFVALADDGQHKFAHVSPMHFRVGDIVEAQITLACVPIKKDKFKTVLHLRSIAMMDSSHTQVRTDCRPT